MIHELPLERRTVHGRWSRELVPVLTIDPGDSVRFETLAIFWWRELGEPFAERAADDGHALTGPIAVRGARAGGTLSVRIDRVDPGAWGVTLTRDPHSIGWELGDGLGRASTGHTVKLAPFLGVIGMPPDEPGSHPTEPPRASGGNIDCKELVAGTTLYLPIPVDGALLSAGDAHALQGDGEVSGTAIETTSHAQLTVDVRDDLELAWPIARTHDAWLTFGFDRDLDRAVDNALDGMVELLQREHGLSPENAIGLASVAVDLRVTQVVNGVKGVHAVLRDDALA
ncbi:MAG TPA: acetamidase/formamidase family protein [Gaiellaceae bacterium]|nr:acetamidase/formamidase family protein [Gaiellaceae bacterium]